MAITIHATETKPALTIGSGCVLRIYTNPIGRSSEARFADVLDIADPDGMRVYRVNVTEAAAEVDATPEIVALAEQWHGFQIAVTAIFNDMRAWRNPEYGNKEVRSTTTRGVNKGITGRVRWIDRDRKRKPRARVAIHEYVPGGERFESADHRWLDLARIEVMAPYPHAETVDPDMWAIVCDNAWSRGVTDRSQIAHAYLWQAGYRHLVADITAQQVLAALGLIVF